jgi:hypothetical protein
MSTSFRFALPAAVLSAAPRSGDYIYRLRVQKQPGTVAPPLSLRIHLPPNASVKSMPDQAILQGQHLLLETTLQTDVEMVLIFSLP